jgi:hypothetical protein
MYGMPHKLTMIVPDKTKATLDGIKKETEMSATEQVRRAVGLLRYILDAQNRGDEFRVYEKDGSYSRVEIILD